MLWAMSDAKDSQTSTTHTKPARPMPMLDDEPILSHETDRLGVLQYADVIAGTALGTVGPFTIGVFGGWGEGKTSILRAAESRLNERATAANATDRVKEGQRHHPHMITVWFNAWQFEREAHPIVPLVASIQKAVIARITQDRTILEKTGEAGKKFFWKLVEGGGKLFSGLKATLPATMTGVEMELEGANVVDAVETLFKGDSNANTNALTRAIDASLGMAVFDEMSRLGSQANDRPAAPGWGFPRVVVFVDDLDRCTPDKAFELIEAIKVVFAQPGFIFVLALNRDVVDVYVRGMWKKRLEADHPSLISRYLDKIIQLPLYVRSHQQAFGTFIDSQFERLKEKGIDDPTLDVFTSVKGHLGEATSFSPRRLVRRINTLLVDQKLRPAPSKDDPDDVKNLEVSQFVGLCLVQRTLLDDLTPEIIREIGDDTEFCKKLATVEVVTGQTSIQALDAAIQEQLHPENDNESLSSDAEAHEVVPFVDVDDGMPSNAKLERWAKHLLKLRPYACCVYVLGTPAGTLWLGSPNLRRLVADFVSSRSRPSVGAASGAPLEPQPILGTADQNAHFDQTIRELDEQMALLTEILGPDKRPSAIHRAKWRAPGVLEQLTLAHTPLTSVGVSRLDHPVFQVKSIERLDLRKTEIGNTALSHLASFASIGGSLLELSLSHTRVGDDGLMALSAPTSHTRALRQLLLSRTLVTDRGLIALAASGTSLANLDTLGLGGTSITDAGLDALAARDCGIHKLGTLYLGNTSVSPEAIARVRERHPGISIVGPS